MSKVIYGHDVHTLEANKLAHEARANGWTIRAALWGRAPKEAPPEPEQVTAPSDGPPRIRSELGGLMGPGYQATGYEPPPRRQVLLDDPTGDDIAGDVP